MLASSKRLRGVEIATGDLDAHGDEIAQETGSHARRLEVTDHRVVGGCAGAHELEYLLHLDDVTLQPRNLGNAGHLALAVGQALELHNDTDSRRDLAADRSDRHRQAGHADHLLEARDRIAWGIGMD